MIELVAPDSRFYFSWLDTHLEWGPGLHEDGFGLLPSDGVVSPAGFDARIARLDAEADPHTADDPAGAHCIYRWIVEDNAVLGGIALRHGESPFIATAGHIGFGIRPSARRRGLATWALREILGDAGALGLDRVLLVCVAYNEPSAHTIERSGGVLESIQDTEHGRARRYWIDIA